MLKDSIGAAEHDMVARALREQQVEAERMIAATVSALASDGDLLDALERGGIERLVETTRLRAGSADADAIKAAIDALAQGTEEFAGRRMNRSIRAALAGKHVEQVFSK